MNQLTYGNINDKVVNSMEPPGRSWMVSMVLILGALSMGVFAWAMQIRHGLEYSGINHPIACGGAAVLPGDLVVGDADGVVVVPRDDAAKVLENVLALEVLEEKRRAAIRSGVIFHPGVDETLRAKGLT